MGRVGRWPGIGLAPVVVSSVMAGAACGVLPDALMASGPDRDESGQVVEPGEVEALEIRVADCFNNPGQDEVALVTVVPCTDPHDFEVFHAFDLPEGPFPGPEAIEKSWIDGCLERFEAFVGSPFDESTLDISAIYPTRQTWDDLGDREILCSVTGMDGVRRAGTARDSGL